ncbi:hypothetical protein [Niveispirillum sp. KHB5.9]|uniref:hypothetical protein n=1 Tax=Niveispirillum sp. KHB5.9 TaxID=3400269 RepID=UPI003A88218F
MMRRLFLVGLAALTMALVFAISGSARANALDEYPAIREHQEQAAELRGLDHHRLAMAGDMQASDAECPIDCTDGGACCGVIHCLTALAGLPSGDALVLSAHENGNRTPMEAKVLSGIRHAPDLRPPVAG